MNWLSGFEVLAGVGLLALSALLVKLFQSKADARQPVGGFQLALVPMFVLLIAVCGIVLIFMGAGIV
jgi:hypothetical protein